MLTSHLSCTQTQRRVSIKLLTSYFELVQVGGALPVFVITDARHAGEADRYAVSGVHLGFGELGACDLPDGRLLQQTTQQK